MNPEVKVVLEIHADAVATAPSADEIKALLGFEPALFVLEKRVIPTERVRAPQIGASGRLEEEVVTWFDAISWDGDEARRVRVLGKVAEVQG